MSLLYKIGNKRDTVLNPIVKINFGHLLGNARIKPRKKKNLKSKFTERLLMQQMSPKKAITKLNTASKFFMIFIHIAQNRRMSMRDPNFIKDS